MILNYPETGLISCNPFCRRLNLNMAFVDPFIQIIIRRAKMVLAVILGITLFFTYQYFQQTHNNHIDIFFDDHDPPFLAYEQFQATYGNEEYGVIALEGGDLFSNQSFAKIRQLTESLETIRGIDRVVSLTNVEEFFGADDYVELRRVVPAGSLTREQIARARERAFANQFVRKHLLNDDGTMTALHVELETMAEKQKRTTVLSMMKTARAVAGGHFTVYVSGSSLVEVEMNRLTERDFNLFVPIIVILIMVFILILFRHLALAVLCQINLLVILLWGVGFFVFCGETFNIITNSMGAILLAIAIADSVHILSHLKETARKTDLAVIPAVRRTIRQVWYPCLFTSLTTGAGFISFYTSEIRPVAMLGLFTAISVIFAFFLSVTVLPALMVLAQKLMARVISGFRNDTAAGSRVDLFTRMLVFCGRIATGYQNRLFMLFILILIISIAGILRIKFETNTFHYLPDTSRIKSDFQVIEKQFGGTIPFVVVIRSETGDFADPAAVKRIEKFQETFLAENEGITSAFSVVEYVKEFNKAFNENNPAFYRVPDAAEDIADAYELGDPEVLERLLSMDRKETCVIFNTIWDSDESGYRLHADVTDYLSNHFHPDFSFHITGLSSLYLTMNKHLQESQIKSFFIAFFIIFLMMIVVCRGFWLAVLSMIPNLFPIFLTLGVMGWAGIPLDVATTMIASVTIGIAVDDTIHFVSWLRRNAAIHKDRKTAIIQTFTDVGKPIVITTFLLFSGFIVLVMGSIIPTRMFGLLTAFSMLFALIGDFFVLSPLVLIFWPTLPPLARKT